MTKGNYLRIACFFTLLLLMASCQKTIVFDETKTDGSEQANDYGWNTEDVINIDLNGNSVSVKNYRVEAYGTVVTIKQPGTYSLKGNLDDGQIIVQSKDTGLVRLIFNGINIKCSNSAPVYIKKSAKTVIILADNTENYLSDGKSYLLNEKNEPNAALFSKAYLSFSGNGSLTVNANYLDGITSKDGMVIKSGKFKVSSADDGIRGKDYLIIHNADISIHSGGKGLKSDNVSESDSGHIVIESGNFNIVSGENGIHCEQSLVIKSGTFDITTTNPVKLNQSGSGYNPSYSSGIRSKNSIDIETADITILNSGSAGRGISAGKKLNLQNGTYKINTTGSGVVFQNIYGITDAGHSSCIKSGSSMKIGNCSLLLSSSGAGGRGITAKGSISFGTGSSSPLIDITTTGDRLQVEGNDYVEAKAIKANGSVVIANGTLRISSADDAIKSEKSVFINNGDISITKSVKGIKAPEIDINGGNISVVSSDNGIYASNGLTSAGGDLNTGSVLSVMGGNIAVNTTEGDAVYSRGNVDISGGNLIVHGPQSLPDVGFKFIGTCKVSGGFLAVSGTGETDQAPSDFSAQYSVKVVSASAIPASTLFHIQDDAGNDIVTFSPARDYSSVIFSSPALINGATYKIFTGGSSNGAAVNGIYSGGIYSGGIQIAGFTISSKVTNVSF